MIKDLRIPQRVKRGFKLLTKEYGRSWLDKINLKTLDARYTDTCPLGQTDSDYISHRDDLGMKNTTAIKYGFSALKGLSVGSAGEYVALTREWKRVIREARKGV